MYTLRHVKSFLRMMNLPIEEDTLSKLIEYKQQNPLSTDLEKAIDFMKVQEPMKTNSHKASRILGIFRANFAQIHTRVNTHFPAPAENCTEEIFLQIFAKLTPEQQDMIQWQQYVPERVKAACRVPLTDIDLSREDYAVVRIAGTTPNANGIRSKARVDHPCFVPIDFTKKVIERAAKAKRNCPFPTHEAEWKKITKIAKNEYQVRLVSNYLRKRYEDIAADSRIHPTIAAFLMGDKTKLDKVGIHLDLIYGRRLRFNDKLAAEVTKSNLTTSLTIKTD